MKTYKKQRSSADGGMCSFYYKDEISCRTYTFYKKYCIDDYEFSNDIINFETELKKDGYVKEKRLNKLNTRHFIK